jgi:hypothetical protein
MSSSSSSNCISSFSNFGWSIDINKLGSGILIGASKSNISKNYEKKNIGRAWYYVKYQDIWRKYPHVSPKLIKNGEFGRSVAINDNNLLAIGEPFYSNTDFNENPFDYGFGAVHLYKFNNTAFPTSEILKTFTGNGHYLSQFGYSIDLNNKGDILVVGAPMDVSNNITGGKVYIYKNTNDSWFLDYTLTGINGSGYFGKCVKINSGNLIVVAENESFHIYDYYSDQNSRNLAFNNIINQNENAFTNIAITNQILYKKNFSVFNNPNPIVLTGWNDNLNNFYFNGQKLMIGVNYTTLSPSLTATISGTTGYYDSFGSSISVNSDGSILFIGANFHQNNLNQNIGKISIYKNNNGQYTLAQDISGTSINGLFGSNLSVSSDGKIIAIANNSQNNGRVWIYQSNNLSDWTLFQTLSGNPGALRFGERLALSPDGTVLTVGSRADVVAPNSTGSMWVYTGGFNRTWAQTQKITGLINPIGFQDIGWPSNQVLNSGGNVLCIGFDSKKVSTDSFAGVVYVYTGFNGVYNFSQELIGDPVGQSSGDLFGRSLAISNNGNILTVGSLHDQNFEKGTLDGALFIFETGSDKKFFLKQKLRGDLDPLLRQNDRFGYFTDMNSDGSIIVTSSQHDEGSALPITNQSVGAFWVYRRNINGLWNLVNKEVGTGINNSFGIPCKLSKDGSTVLIGESPTYNYGTRGNVKIYTQDVFSHDVTFKNNTMLYNGITGVLMAIPKSYNDTIIKRNSFDLEYNNFQTIYNYNYNKFIDTDFLGNEILVGNPYHKTGVTKLYEKLSQIWQNTYSFTGLYDFQSLGASVGLSYIGIRPPNKLIVTNISETSFVVNWDSIGNSISYQIDVATNNSFTNFAAGYNNKTVNQTYDLITGLSPGTNYYIRVRAVGTENISLNSNVLTQITVPLAPNQPVITDVTDITFTASWNAVVGATSYRLDIATDSAFTNFVTNYQNRIVNRNVSVIGLTPNTTYYVRVRAVNTVTANTLISSNSLEAIVITNMLAPQATNITTNSFIVNWDAVINAASYRLDVATNSEFTNFVTNYRNKNINNTNDLIIGLDPGVIYYVRVRAVNSSGVVISNSQALVQITVPVAPSQPLIRNVTSTNFDVSWNSVVGASQYQIDVATTGDFSDNFLEDYNNRIVNGLNLNVNGLDLGATYYTRVRAINTLTSNIVTGENSLVNSQTTYLSPPNELIVSGITINNFTIDWITNEENIAYYLLDVSKNVDFTDFVTNYNNKTVYITNDLITGLSPGTNYYTRLRSVNNDDIISINSQMLVQMTTPLAPNKPIITNRMPTSFTVSGNTVTGASEYRIDVATTSGFSNSILENYNDRILNDNFIDIRELSPSTAYYTRVRAVNTLTSNTVISENSLIESGITLLSAPDQFRAIGITTSGFNLKWDSVPSAVNYQLDVSTNLSFSGFVDGFNNKIINTTSGLITGLMPGSFYYNRARAIGSNGDVSPNSLTFVQGTLPVPPNQLTVTGITTNSFIVNWDPVNGALNYLLDISTGNNFTSYLNNYDNKIISGTSDLITGLSTGRIYYVRVSAQNFDNISSYSPTLAQITVPAAPNQPTITNITAATFTASWNIVTGASAYRIDVATGFDFSTGFATTYNNRLVSQNSISVIGLSSNTTYYTRVRAVNTGTSNIVTSTNSLPRTVLTLSL